MAELNTGGGGHQKGAKKARSKKLSTRVDLTPMVDLGFLLITFFMLATTLIKPQTMEINMPRNDKVDKKDQTLVKASKSITIILSKHNKVFYFFGEPDPKTGPKPEVIPTDFSKDGLRKMLLDRNAPIVAQIKELKKEKDRTRMTDEEYRKRASVIRSGDAAAIVMITATDDAKYDNLVNVLDEMQICNVSKYAIIDLSPIHKQLIKPLDN
ncbi:MAG: biopolymer transporter ExbD [Bacteroidota bacterium]|nr:biopolymer transporter ExbD [Bacteroidota bacterium]